MQVNKYNYTFQDHFTTSHFQTNTETHSTQVSWSGRGVEPQQQTCNRDHVVLHETLTNKFDKNSWIVTANNYPLETIQSMKVISAYWHIIDIDMAEFYINIP